MIGSTHKGLTGLLLGFATTLLAVHGQAEDYPKVDQLCDFVLGGTTKMRYCRNRALSSTNPQVTRAVIVIPGSESPAKAYYDKVLKIAREEGLDDTTTIIVPQFLEDDGEGQTVLQKLGLPNDYAYWGGGWRQGNTAKNGNKVSSFAMLDFIVEKLIEHNPKTLKHIAVVGHSAGGQFVNRYAAGTDIVSFALSQDVSMSFGVSSAGSFVYFDEQRPVMTAAQRRVLTALLGADPIATRCPGYNDYKYGLEGLNSYMNKSSDTDIKFRSISRHVRYFVGAEDTKQDTGCEVTYQGDHHVVRMQNYQAHLAHICNSFGTFVCGAFGFQPANAFSVIAGTGHNSTDLFRSTVGRNILFYWE